MRMSKKKNCSSSERALGRLGVELHKVTDAEPDSRSGRVTPLSLPLIGRIVLGEVAEEAPLYVSRRYACAAGVW